MKNLLVLLIALKCSQGLANTRFNLKSHLGQVSSSSSGSGDSHGISVDVDYWFPVPVAASITFGEELVSLKPENSQYKTLLRTKILSLGLGVKTQFVLNSRFNIVLSGHYSAGSGQVDLNRSTEASFTKANYSSDMSGIQTASTLTYHINEYFQISTGLTWSRLNMTTPQMISSNEARAGSNGLSLVSATQNRQEFSLPSDLSLDKVALHLGLGVSFP